MGIYHVCQACRKKTSKYRCIHLDIHFLTMIFDDVQMSTDIDVAAAGGDNKLQALRDSTPNSMRRFNVRAFHSEFCHVPPFTPPEPYHPPMHRTRDLKHPTSASLKIISCSLEHGIQRGPTCKLERSSSFLLRVME